MKKNYLVRTMVLALALSMSAFVACGKTDEAGDSNVVANEEQAEVSVAGTYVYSFTEEFDGEVIDLTSVIVLNDDNTCEVTFQDTIAGKWDGSKITLDDGSEFEYKIEDGNVVLNQDGVWNTYYKEEESNVNPPVVAAMEKYDSIISGLQPGQAYGFADICTAFDVLLVSEDGAYDCGDGTMGAVNVKIYGLDADGNVMEYGVANSGHTAYPLAVYDGCLMTCNNARTMMEYINADSLSMITRKCVEVSYDEDGNASYAFMDADTQTDGVADDDSMMQEMLDMYSNATVINFTVVE